MCVCRVCVLCLHPLPNLSVFQDNTDCVGLASGESLESAVSPIAHTHRLLMSSIRIDAEGPSRRIPVVTVCSSHLHLYRNFSLFFSVSFFVFIISWVDRSAVLGFLSFWRRLATRNNYLLYLLGDFFYLDLIASSFRRGWILVVLVELPSSLHQVIIFSLRYLWPFGDVPMTDGTHTSSTWPKSISLFYFFNYWLVLDQVGISF